MKRIFASSDIHGRYMELDMLLKDASFDFNYDKLFLLGDYVDINNYIKSIETIEYIMNITTKGAIALKGNNDLKFIEVYKVRPEITEFIKSLNTIEVYDKYIFVHAGIKPGIPLNKQNDDDLLNIRGEFHNYPTSFGKIVVFGHTPAYMLGAPKGEVYITNDKICIDTGAGHGIALSLVELNNMKVYTKFVKN